MKRPIWMLALRLGAKNALLQEQNRNLTRDLALAYGAVRKITDERDQARRDVDLLCLMAHDRRVAAEFVQSSHNLKRLPETEAGG